MKDIKLGKLQKVYQGKIFTMYEREVTLKNGKKQIWEYCKRVPSVCVLAFNVQNKLLLLKEKRQKATDAEWFLPGGKVDGREAPKIAARRELQEEAGYLAQEIQLVYKKYSSSTTLLWDIYVFAARDLTWKPLKGDEVYPIEVVPVSLKRAVTMAKDGTIKNEFIAYTIIRFFEMLKHKEFVW